METCKTVKITADNEQGFYIINEEDFNDGEHTLFVEGSGTILTIPQIKNTLDAMGIEYPATAKKADLLDLLG